MGFKDLKKNAAQNFAKIQEDAKAINKPAYDTADPDEWYPAVDKAGNGLHVIRFLPPVNDDDLAFVKTFTHEFQDANTKQWYIEKCRSTIAGNFEDDPVLNLNSKFWKAYPGDENKNHPIRKQAANQGRKTHYHTNIYIVSDGVNPENNGTVKKFKFGKWAWDKIEAALFNKFGKPNVDVFDMFNGANFVIEIKTEKKDGKLQRNYTNSYFEREIGPLLENEDEMEKIYNSISKWSLKSYLDEKHFKSYEDLKKRLDVVVGYDSAEWTKEGRAGAKEATRPSPKPVESKKSATVDSPTIKEEAVSEGENEDEDFFNKLTDDDAPPF